MQRIQKRCLLLICIRVRGCSGLSLVWLWTFICVYILIINICIWIILVGEMWGWQPCPRHHHSSSETGALLGWFEVGNASSQHPEWGRSPTGPTVLQCAAMCNTLHGPNMSQWVSLVTLRSSFLVVSTLSTVFVSFKALSKWGVDGIKEANRFELDAGGLVLCVSTASPLCQRKEDPSLLTISIGPGSFWYSGSTNRRASIARECFCWDRIACNRCC